MRLRLETSLQVLLVLIAIVGYWPVIGFEYTLKWDIIDQYFPWRMFIVECLRSGVFPLWNPYEQLGTPIFADPQSGYWYAPVWLSALFGEYSLRSVQVEYFAHVALGGLGMFRLLRSFSVEPTHAFFLALAYVFSGFFTGNAQHLTYVVSGCWMPFVLWSFKRLLSGDGGRSVIRFCLFSWLLITGGYPAFSIILFYLLLVLWAVQLWNLRSNPAVVRALILRSVSSVLLLGVLLSGLVYTLWQGNSYFSRTEGLDYGIAAFGPFSPRSVISLMFPLAAVRNPEFFNTDISMSSAYLGWFALAGFILFVFGKKKRCEWWLLGAVLFFLLASFGKYTPVHRFLYSYLPMMDWFRFPSVFRLFAMIGILLASGLALSGLSRIRPMLILHGAIVLLLFAVLYRLGGLTGIEWPSSQQWGAYFRNIPFEKALAFQGVLLAMALVVVFLVFIIRIKLKIKILFLSIVGLVELIVFARMSLPVTVISEYRTRSTQVALDSARTRGFPIPDMRPMVLNQDSGPFPAPFWKNLNLFRKQPAWDGYNNFQLRNYVRFFDQEQLRVNQLSRPWVCFADTVLTYSDSIIPVFPEGKKVAYLEEVVSKGIPTGTAHPGNRIVVTGFEPGHATIDAGVESDSALLVMMQQHYPGWRVTVDGSPVTMHCTDYLFQSVWIRKGKHNVDWVYGNVPVRVLTILCLFTGFVCILSLVFPGRWRARLFPATRPEK